MDDSFYEEASSILAHRLSKHSLRACVFESQCKNKRALLRFLSNVLELRAILDSIITNSLLFEKEKSIFISIECATVFAYEFLFGRNVRCCKRHRNALERNAAALLSEKKRLVAECVISSDGKVLDNSHDSEQADNPTPLPRYARLNPLQSEPAAILDELKSDGWTSLTMACKGRKKYRSLISALPSDHFYIDNEVPDLLVFPAGTDFHQSAYYNAGRLILQDKSSCLPVICLAPPAGSLVIDACAAPGMKTSHIAAIMQNKGKIIAVDFHRQRFQTLCEMLTWYGATCAQPLCEDFLKLSHADKRVNKAEYILVDPPCSGSGIVSRKDSLTDIAESKSSSRLSKLHNLQVMMLQHALAFPAVLRVVYSTCSTFVQENEEVVGEALARFGESFDLVNALPAWRHRGSKEYEVGKRCLRASPKRDLTNGFFVAVFERKH